MSRATGQLIPHMSPPEGNVLSLDPGIRTGWAYWDELGTLLYWGNIETLDNVWTLISSYYAYDIVYEDYRLRYGRQPAADSHHTASQIIGALKYRARGATIQLWPQEVEVLTVEAMHLGLERPKDHKNGHYVDAVLHGAYWFRRVGLEPDVSRLAAGSSA